MTRSRRKNPFAGNTTAQSDKQDKLAANRANRRINKQVLNSTHDDTVLKPLRQTSDEWLMDKDGKSMFDTKENPELLRK